jgi:hypothetical protein
VLVVVSVWKMICSSYVNSVKNNKTVKNLILEQNARLATTLMTMRMRMIMSDTIYHHLGENWDMIFNVDDYYHLIEDYLEVEDEECIE